MAIERNLIFCHGNAYDINLTMAYVREMYERMDPDEFPEFRLECIISVLMDYRFLHIVDLETFIPDPFTGIETPMNLWLRDNGIVDHRLEYWDESVHTFDMTDDEMESIDDECIEQDEDDHELLVGVRILASLNADTQDIDELFDYGHDQDDPLDQFDSFLE